MGLLAQSSDNTKKIIYLFSLINAQIQAHSGMNNTKSLGLQDHMLNSLLSIVYKHHITVWY